MSSTSKLGKGLTALLDTNQEQERSENTEVAIELLQPNPWQPRTNFSDENLQELATSIKNQGIIQPLLVREMPDKSYQIIAGERRLRAAKLVGLTTVPVFVRKMSDEDVMTAALIENLQREDLNPIEEALALKNLRDELHVTQEVLSAKLGKSRSAIANALRLLQLSPQAQEDVRAGRLSAGHARSLLSIADQDIAESMRKYIVQKELSVRDTEDIIAKWKKEGIVPWEDSELQDPVENAMNQDLPQEERSLKKNNQSDIAKKMQEVFSQVLQCKAKVRGTEEKGKITLTYSSAEELQQILLKLGANGQENPGTDANESETDVSEQKTSDEASEVVETSIPDEQQSQASAGEGAF
ncbi:MAG: ParB/RepB/Spo0J family partition protein [Desulfovibrio sp.]|nr:ParB/RepB/Spo0J family partition protein [Desulfovibrio sp.]